MMGLFPTLVNFLEKSVLKNAKIQNFKKIKKYNKNRKK